MQQHAIIFHPPSWIFHLSQFSSRRQTVLIHHDCTLKPFCAHTFAPRNVIWGVVFTHLPFLSDLWFLVQTVSPGRSVLTLNFVFRLCPHLDTSCHPCIVFSSAFRHSFVFSWNMVETFLLVSLTSIQASSRCPFWVLPCTQSSIFSIFITTACVEPDNRHRLAIEDSLPFGFETTFAPQQKCSTKSRLRSWDWCWWTIRRQLIHGSAQGFFLWTNPQKMYWNMKRMKEKMGETNEECEKMVEEKSNTRRHDTWMVNRRVRHHYLKMWRVRAFWSLHTPRGVRQIDVVNDLATTNQKNELQNFFHMLTWCFAQTTTRNEWKRYMELLNSTAKCYQITSWRCNMFRKNIMCEWSNSMKNP